MDLNLDLSDAESLLRSALAVGPWVGHLISLNLIFLILKNGETDSYLLEVTKSSHEEGL